jgi:hypothetical protein
MLITIIAHRLPGGNLVHILYGGPTMLKTNPGKDTHPKNKHTKHKYPKHKYPKGTLLKSNIWSGGNVPTLCYIKSCRVDKKKYKNYCYYIIYTIEDDCLYANCYEDELFHHFIIYRYPNDIWRELNES